MSSGLPGDRGYLPALGDGPDGLIEARNEDATERHNTLVGHSYGGTTIGKTAQDHNMPVDDMILVGAPGVDAPTADDLKIPEGHVWATADENDPVAEAPVHDANPAGEGFGAKVFESNSNVEGKWWQAGYNAESHSLYWEANNPSLETMGKIIAGQAPR